METTLTGPMAYFPQFTDDQINLGLKMMYNIKPDFTRLDSKAIIEVINTWHVCELLISCYFMIALTYSIFNNSIFLFNNNYYVRWYHL